MTKIQHWENLIGETDFIKRNMQFHFILITRAILQCSNTAKFVQGQVETAELSVLCLNVTKTFCPHTVYILNYSFLKWNDVPHQHKVTFTLSMSEMIWRISWSWRKSSPCLNITGYLPPSSVLKNSCAGIRALWK